MKTIKIILGASLLTGLLSTGPGYGAVWTTLRLTRTPGASLTPKIAVDGSAVYIVWSDRAPGNEEIYFKKSTDGGVTWQDAQRLTSNAGSSVSPAVAAEGLNVYVVWADSTPGISQVFFTKSDDGGAHWQAARALSGHKTAAAWTPALAVVDADVYVVWHNDARKSGEHSTIMFRKSVDGGATWRTAVAFPETRLFPDALNPAVAAAGPCVYVGWEANWTGHRHIYVRASKNQGDDWQAAYQLTKTVGVSVRPALAAQGSSVYVVWEDATDGAGRIYLRKSVNRGAFWPKSMELTKNAGASHAPALAVNGSSLYAVWEEDTKEGTDLFLRKSTNEGIDWTAVKRLTINSGASRRPSVAVGGAKIFVTWQDDAPGNNEIYLMHKTIGPYGLAILSPTATTVWARGATAEIRWMITEGLSGETPWNPPGIDQVKIDLYRGTALKTRIVAKTDAVAGRYSWPVPLSLESGANYKIRIASTADDRIFKTSPLFKIGGIGMPDLVIASLTHNPQYPTSAQSVTITVVVKNQGSLAAGASHLAIPLGTPMSRPVPALAAGASCTVTQTAGPLGPGIHTYIVTADWEHEVAESDESNNDKRDDIMVSGLPSPAASSLTGGFMTSGGSLTAVAGGIWALFRLRPDGRNR